MVQVDGDVDAAIEFLVAEQATEEHEEPSESTLCDVDSSFGNVRSSIFLIYRIIYLAENIKLDFFEIF